MTRLMDRCVFVFVYYDMDVKLDATKFTYSENYRIYDLICIGDESAHDDENI